jgi:predicted MPP superfamily phosphohydrolase
MSRRHNQRKLQVIKKTMQRTGMYELGAKVGDQMSRYHPQGQQLHVTEHFLSDRLGRKIAVIADIHADGRSVDHERIEQIGELARSIPDVWFYAFVGDYVNDDHAEMIDPICEMIESLAAPSVVVLGNHDYRAGIRRLIGPLERTGAHVLRNEHIRLDGVDIAGIDCWTTHHDDAQKAVSGCVDPYIVLGHEPFLATMHEGYVHIAGHTHHGQVNFGTRKVFLPRGSEPYPAGHYRLPDDRHVYTTSGIGYSVVPARVAALPEIAVLHV